MQLTTRLHRCVDQTHRLAHQAYSPIAGAGEASAILHYTDNNALMRDGQIFLVDAGGQYLGYTTDITRTHALSLSHAHALSLSLSDHLVTLSSRTTGSYPVNGQWTADQALIYNLVLDLQTKGISMMLPGANYTAVYIELRRYYNQLLLKAGFVQGDLDGLDANSISNYFGPHGFVHHVGTLIPP
jgi:Xaa-Pro aminopeptidase